MAWTNTRGLTSLHHDPLALHRRRIPVISETSVSALAAPGLTVNVLYTRGLIWNGTTITTGLVQLGAEPGSLPIAPLPMSVMPVAKSRIDVHAFSFTVGPTARRSGHLNLTVPAGLSNFFNVVAYQSAVPGANKGALPDAREFDQMLMTADIINDTTLRISWVSTGPVIGNYNAYYQIKN